MWVIFRSGLCSGDVDIDIPLRINDCARAGTAEQIRTVSQAFDKKVLDKHFPRLSGMLLNIDSLPVMKRKTRFPGSKRFGVPQLDCRLGAFIHSMCASKSSFHAKRYLADLNAFAVAFADSPLTREGANDRIKHTSPVTPAAAA